MLALFHCVKSGRRIEYLVKKSRFIGVISPCGNKSGVKATLKQIATECSDATHSTYAYRLKTGQGLNYRFHDAGEPSGTAGKLIYQSLDGKGLLNLFIAVARYYGGIKLGAGGFTRTSGDTAKNLIQLAELKPYREWVAVRLNLDCKEPQAVEYPLKKRDGQIIQQDFFEQIKLTMQLPDDQVAEFKPSFPSAY